MKIAVLTTKNSWFEPYAKQLTEQLNAFFTTDYSNLKNGYDVVFILSYYRILPAYILKQNKHNVVVHESDLPHGKGWAPLIWQVLEGRSQIPFSLFEASQEMDSGDIYLKKFLNLSGYELHDELRHKQALLTMTMCKEFIDQYDQMYPEKQVGKESFYPKRTPKDSELDVDKTISEQFNLLRTVDNENYPAFFEIDGYKYKLKIERNNK